MILRLVCAFVLVGLLAPCPGISAPLPMVSEGAVRFYNIADKDFDRFSLRPSGKQQQWMRKHYARMQTYSPYFDDRVTWYPNAWVYKDSYAIKPHWEIFESHPEWVLRDERDRMLYIPWGCRDGRCPQYAADVGNPDFRANWIAEARARVGRGYRGIWVDDVNLAWRVSDGEGNHVRPVNPRTGRPMTLHDWQTSFTQFMEEIRAAFPDIEIAHNSIWYADDFDKTAIVRQIEAADYINLERGATDPGLEAGSGRWGLERFLSFVDAIHARGRGVIFMDYGASERQREYGLAAWLLISSGIDLMSSNQLRWTAPGFFWTGYSLNLQQALGPRYQWKGLLRRDFRCGMVLLNQPERAKVRVHVPAGATDLQDKPIEQVSLGGSEAQILRTECVTTAN